MAGGRGVDGLEVLPLTASVLHTSWEFMSVVHDTASVVHVGDDIGRVITVVGVHDTSDVVSQCVSRSSWWLVLIKGGSDVCDATDAAHCLAGHAPN